MKKHKWKILFVLYSALMLWLLFDRVGYDPTIPYWDQLKYNLVPLHTIRLFWRIWPSAAAIINLGGNVIMFIPLGFLLPRACPKLNKFFRCFFTCALIIILVEVTQLFTLLGSCDIDDLILNMVGSTLGFIMHKMIKTKCAHRRGDH